MPDFNPGKIPIVFAGTPDFSVPTLQALIDEKYDIKAVYTQPDRPAGRGRKLTPSPVKQLALEHNILIKQPVSLKSKEAQDELFSLDAKLMIVVAYGLLLPEAVLNSFEYGCLNIHGSILPRFRGAAPIQRAILAGDKKTGVCIMHMEKGLDTGPVYACETCDITHTTNSQALYNELANLGAKTLIKTLADIITGNLTAIAQDDSLSTYAKKIEKSEGLIDWSQAGINIIRQIKAFNPWPVAFTHLNDQSIRIWDAQLGKATSTQAPGTVIGLSKSGIEVVSIDGSILITKAQFPGAKARSIPDLANTNKIKLGDRLL